MRSTIMTKIALYAIAFPTLASLLGMLVCTLPARATQSVENEAEHWFYQQIIRDRCNVHFRIMTFGMSRETRENMLTFGREKQLDLSHRQGKCELRPDVYFDGGPLYLSFKPRLTAQWRSWNSGSLTGESEISESVFINEWMARIMASPFVFLSYGRENLQWGPSYLISPSNPFIRDNGRNTPLAEVAGADFARVVSIPDSHWTISLIANTAKGEQNYIGEFKRTYALKIDYTVNKHFFSLIPHFSESDRHGIGYYKGWNATDALILHSEGRVFDGNYEWLGGASYTMLRGTTLTAEIYHNSAGSTADPFFTAFPPFGDANPDNQLFRRNYILLQIMRRRIMNMLNATIRCIYNMNETTSLTIGMLEYEASDNIQLFAVGSYDSGGRDDEFGFAVKFTTILGAQYSF